MNAVVLFDGFCNLCHASVRFILRRDPRGYFRFASLQSDPGRELLARCKGEEDGKSLVLVEDGECWEVSDAALRIARRLKFPWPLFFYLGIWMPKFFRDPVYRWIAKNRYRWFGRRPSCEIEDPKLKSRILASGPPSNPRDASPREID